jgi:hypothetical protein
MATVRIVFLVLFILLLAGTTEAYVAPSAGCDPSGGTCTTDCDALYNSPGPTFHGWAPLGVDSFGWGLTDVCEASEQFVTLVYIVNESSVISGEPGGPSYVLAVCPSAEALGGTVTAANCSCGSDTQGGPFDVPWHNCGDMEAGIVNINLSNAFFIETAPVPSLVPFTGFVVGAQAITGVGTVILAVVTLTGAIVAIIAAFAVLTLVTRTVKALSGPLMRGLEE